MTGYPRCKDCACFFRAHANAKHGQCRARAPVPIMVGVSQPAALPGIIGKNGVGQAQPVVNGFFAPVNEDIWCMDWQPLAQEAEETTAAAMEPTGASV